MNAGPVYIPILFIQNRYDWKSFYNSRLEEVKRGVDTYWLSQPLTTSVKSALFAQF